MLNQKGLFCVGTYSERPRRNFKGMAYFKFDPENLNNKVSRLNPFPESFLIEAYGESRGSRRASREVGIEHLEYRDFYLDEHGNIFFNAEEVLSRRQRDDRYYFGNQEVVIRNERRNTLYNNIFSTKINPSGDWEYLSVVKKSQNSRYTEEEFLSFSSALINGRMHLFFNAGGQVREDRSGNYTFPPTRLNRLNLYAVEINADGSLNYSKIIDRKDSRLTYKAQFGLHTNSGGKLILEAERRRDKQLLKLGGGFNE